MFSGSGPLPAATLHTYTCTGASATRGGGPLRNPHTPHLPNTHAQRCWRDPQWWPFTQHPKGSASVVRIGLASGFRRHRLRLRRLHLCHGRVAVRKRLRCHGCGRRRHCRRLCCTACCCRRSCWCCCWCCCWAIVYCRAFWCCWCWVVFFVAATAGAQWLQQWWWS